MVINDLIELAQILHKQGKMSNIFTDKNGVNSEINQENKLLYRFNALNKSRPYIFDYQ